VYVINIFSCDCWSTLSSSAVWLYFRFHCSVCIYELQSSWSTFWSKKRKSTFLLMLLYISWKTVYLQDQNNRITFASLLFEREQDSTRVQIVIRGWHSRAFGDCLMKNNIWNSNERGNAFTSRLLNIISLNMKQTLKRCTFVRVCMKKFKSANSDSSLQYIILGT